MSIKRQYWIASFSGGLEPHEVEPVLHQEITEARHSQLHALFSFAARYHSREEFILVETNFGDFQKTAHSAATAADSTDTDRQGKRLKVVLLNWILSFRAFLDHHETHLKRTYGGKSSDEFGRFGARCSQAYDQHFAYRFLYKLRNYSQHCGFPPISIHVDQTQVPSVIQPILSRDALLGEYDEWGAKLRDELQAMDRLIPLVPLVEETMDELRDLEALLLDIDAALFETAQREAHAMRRLVSDETHRVALVDGELAAAGRFTALRLGVIPRWLTG